MIRISDLRLNDYVAHEIFKGKITRGTVVCCEHNGIQILWEDGKRGNFKEGMQIENYLTLLSRITFDMIYYRHYTSNVIKSFNDYSQAKKCFDELNYKDNWRVVRRVINRNNEIIATETLGYSIPNG